MNSGRRSLRVRVKYKVLAGAEQGSAARESVFVGQGSVVGHSHAGEVDGRGAVVEQFDHVGGGASIREGERIGGQDLIDPHRESQRRNVGRINAPDARGGNESVRAKL